MSDISKVLYEMLSGPNATCLEHSGKQWDLKRVLGHRTWQEDAFCPKCLACARREAFVQGAEPDQKKWLQINLYLRFLLNLPAQGVVPFQIMQEHWEEWKKRWDEEWEEKWGKSQKNSEKEEEKKNYLFGVPPDIEDDLLQVTDWALKGDSGWKAELGSSELIADRLVALAQWLLQRYSLPRAYALLRAARKIRGNKPNGAVSAVHPWWAFIFALLSLGLLLGTGMGGNAALLGFCGMTIPFIMAWIVGFFFWGLLKSGLIPFLLPRQFGALFVGYLLVLISGDFLRFLYTLGQCPAVFLWCLLCTAATVLYVTWEAHTRLMGAVSWPEAFWRALAVIGLGWVESLFMGGAMFGIMGPLVNQAFPDWRTPPLPLNYGTPLCGQQVGFVFVVIATALLFGIFLQIFWEDRPITDPL